MPTKTQSSIMSGSSQVGVSGFKDYRSLQELVIVPGHAVYVGKEKEHANNDDYWLGGFRGEAPYYTQHALAGVDIAGKLSKSLLVFSGGITRDVQRPDGETSLPLSESQSYYILAGQFRWNELPEVRARATIDDFARDSFENVAFSTAVFYRMAKKMPDKVVVCGWEFKRTRYLMHADALGLPMRDFTYLGVNNPEGIDERDLSTPLGKAIAGEEKAVGDFATCPLGNVGPLYDKKLKRDPWLRGQVAEEMATKIFPVLNIRRV
ncbi:MAG: hypothetical protein KGH57_01745 [Candidatus Micrarchaeota archaeon]|nr:hypothetical protein [Candidatus Micrarchaeota archaeon]